MCYLGPRWRARPPPGRRARKKQHFFTGKIPLGARAGGARRPPVNATPGAPLAAGRAGVRQLQRAWRKRSAVAVRARCVRARRAQARGPGATQRCCSRRCSGTSGRARLPLQQDRAQRAAAVGALRRPIKQGRLEPIAYCTNARSNRVEGRFLGARAPKSAQSGASFVSDLGPVLAL